MFLHQTRHTTIHWILAATLAFVGFLAIQPGQNAFAQPYDVCPSACSFQSIQAAINAASPGSTVSIGPGTYQESITLRAGVSLRGAGAAQTILRSNGALPVILAAGGDIGRTTVVEELAVTNGGGSFGGGMLVRQNAAPTVRNVAVYGNGAAYAGGGVSAQDGADILLEGVQIHDNTTRAGAGLNIYHARATITGGRFENNTAVDNGGAIFASNHSTLTMDGVVVVGNHANLGGGLSANDSTVRVTNSRFEGNRAGAIGGAIQLMGASDSFLVGNTIVNNQAKDGAGIHVVEGQASIIDNIIRDNQATGYGAGVAISRVAYVVLRNNRIEYNRAGIDGGGMVFQRGSTGIIENNVISFNQAGSVGGGMTIYQVSSESILRNNRFEGNLAEQDGGAIQIEDGSVPIIENCDFVDNVANRYGGAVVVNINSIPKIRYSSFIGNRAGLNGGAIFVHSGSQARIEKNVISRNHAGSVGGGLIVLNDNNSLIADNIISRNEADGQGGGIYVSGSVARVSGNQVVDNVTPGNGGGLVIKDASPMVTNTLVARNQSGAAGDGFYISNSNATIIYNTVTDNDQAGGGHGIFVANGARPIVSYNVIQKNGIGIGGTSQPAQMIRNCFWGNSMGNYSGITPGTSDFLTDPMMTKGLLGPYYLSQIASGQSSTSPLVDASNQTAQAAGLANKTTRTDQQPDQGLADIGFHYGRLPGRTQFVPMVALSN